MIILIFLVGIVAGIFATKWYYRNPKKVEGVQLIVGDSIEIWTNGVKIRCYVGQITIQFGGKPLLRLYTKEEVRVDWEKIVNTTIKQ